MKKKEAVAITYGKQSRTSLPNVLEQYGMKDAKSMNKGNEVKPTADRHHHGHRPSSGFESQLEKEKQKNEKYMQVFKDFQKAKKYYYSRYMKNLKEKVELQREKIQQKTDELNSKILEKERKEEYSRHHLKKRLKRVDVTHNDDFLHSIPKSDFYKIVKLEKLMKARGKLNNQMDVDSFWINIKKPEVFYSYFGRYPKGDFESDYEYRAGSDHSYHTGVHTSAGSSAGAQSEHDRRPAMMSAVPETGESTRPTTQHVQVGNRIVEETESDALLAKLNTENMTLTELGRKAAYELDRRCPKVELPDLACFQLELGEKPPDPEEEMRKAEFKARENHRKGVVKTVQKMYRLAMAHNASALRILDRHTDDISQVLDQTSIRDITGTNCFSPTLIQSSQRQLRPLSVPSARQLVPIQDSVCQENVTVPKSPSLSSHSAKISRRSKTSGVSREISQVSVAEPQPLSIESLVQHKSTVEPKTLSTFWNNYLKVGKSTFAPS